VPKLIDHARRREELAEAAWRVLLRDGIGHVSVRNVAAEAGRSVSSLRHVFSTQEELLSFALRLVLERVTDRVTPLLPITDRDTAEAVALEFLPLDAERRAESEVYLTLFMAASANPGLRQLRTEAYEALRYACENLIRSLGDGNDLAPGLDHELEARRLHALLDGLAAHLIFNQPGDAPSWARRVVRAHLDALTVNDPDAG
jgi:AcrR family transcriptional regulator